MDNEKTEKTQLPSHIFIIPMRLCPVFPGLFTTVEVTEPLDMDVLKYSEKYPGFGIVMLKDNDKPGEELDTTDLERVGTFVKVKNKITTIYNTKSLYLETVCRFRIDEIYNNNGIFSATVTYIEETELSEVEQKAYLQTIRKQLRLRDDHPAVMENIRFNASNIPEAIRLTDYLASVIVPRERQQEFLETFDARQRIEKLLEVMRDDLQAQQLQKEIQASVSRKFDQRQKEFFLREELKTIKDELERITGSAEDSNVPDLNASDIKNGLTGRKPAKKKLYDRLVDLNLTGEVYETVFNEYSKMQGMETANPEYSSLRTYLELVADLPWNTFSKDSFDLKKAKRILESDHYGIKEVKERIIEFLAVRKLKNDTKGSIICLVGPPGTGKTSVGVSIAKALNKKYYRFSVGGMRDEAEIKGHRRTYLGSMPGQIIKGLRITKTKNPVFVIDEIDKLTVSNQGDPSAALLEVLDPEQNTTFRDHYLDVPFDISNVLFIVTANTLETIPGPLLDRMEIIELNGYTSQEKLHIGKKYLVPKSLEKHGLEKSSVKYPDKVLLDIAEHYAREAGVRNFEKALDKMNRKIACDVVTENLQLPLKVDEKMVIRYLGQPIFHEDEIIRADKSGMSIGLAWTSMGGDVLAIEAQHIPGKGELKLTGQLGDVMKESANIAFSYIKSIAQSRNIDLTWFDKNSIHLHVPEGATPKDGPSAGITMATALYSLITDTVMTPDMAMTGELSLLGKVMPIGGLKEKILAAKRNRIKKIIFPKHNQRDLDKLDDNVKEGITFYPVSDMQEVLSLAFGEKE